jgi:F-type H+-transporting ATPase subunit gamma
VKDSADCDRIVIIYNEFKNVISQILRKLEILSKKDFQRMFKLVFKHKIVHPGPQYSSHYFYDFYVCSAFYNALLNNLASEQSSRMNAMENASKNAG